MFVAVCVVLATAAAAVAIWPERFTGAGRSVTVYCAHDAVFAKEILDEFQRQTGIDVNVRYDTEATKSLSFVNQLKLEKDDPHCDVFWNNELLGTMDFAHDGLLEPYKGSGYQRIPAAYKDADGRWTGFAARMRVWIVNTKQAEPTQASVRERFEKNPARAVIARPLYGTTLTQYSLLWQLWGPERLKRWDADMPPPGTARSRRQCPGQGCGRGRSLRRRLDRYRRLFRGLRRQKTRRHAPVADRRADERRRKRRHVFNGEFRRKSRPCNGGKARSASQKSPAAAIHDHYSEHRLPASWRQTSARSPAAHRLSALGQDGIGFGQVAVAANPAWPGRGGQAFLRRPGIEGIREPGVRPANARRGPPGLSDVAQIGVAAMSLAAVCAWSFVRSAVLALLAVSFSKWITAEITSAPTAAFSGATGHVPVWRTAWRRFFWILLLAPFLVPHLLVGYAYSGLAMALLHHPAWNEAAYCLLLFLKFFPAAVVIRLYAPPSPVSAEAIHCQRLLRQTRGPRLVQFFREAATWIFGPGRTSIAAFAIVFLLTFQEFEIASLMENGRGDALSDQLDGVAV